MLISPEIICPELSVIFQKANLAIWSGIEPGSAVKLLKSDHPLG